MREVKLRDKNIVNYIEYLLVSNDFLINSFVISGPILELVIKMMNNIVSKLLKTGL